MINADLPPEELVREVLATEYTRIPLWRDKPENIIGVLHAKDLLRALRAVQAGYIWINGASTHHVGVPFGGFKQSGIGREESIEELLACTQIKNVNVTLKRNA